MSNFDMILLDSIFLGPCALAIWVFVVFTDPKYHSRSPSPPAGPSFTTSPFYHLHSDNSTKECPWRFPKGHPYQIYGGPHSSLKMQVWTDAKKLPGYRLVEDIYSDRLYHVWSPAAEMEDGEACGCESCQKGDDDD